LLIGFNFETLLVGVWLCFRSISITLYDVASPVIVNKLIDYDRATFLSWFSFLSTVGRFLALLVLGVIADLLGIGTIWIGAGSILIITNYFLYGISKGVD
jgi:Na+-translocating ferredoxin:NAD+ oxidoreductase RnfE subunit